jgi:hypothetical protein
MKSPYIQLYKKIGDIKVYIVDGNYVRTHQNIEFTNFAQNARFPKMIPKDEFWLDKQYGNQEYNYFVSHLLAEMAAIKEGKTFSDAYNIGTNVQQQLRMAEKPRPLDKKLWKKIDGLSIFIVRGDVVRDKYNINFTEGGHDLIYKWIPKNEVWLDDDLSLEERSKVLLHELYERDKMSRGIKYPQAHFGSSIIEQEYRRTRKLPKKRAFRGFAAIKGIK